jgi:hypothetical protein
MLVMLMMIYQVAGDYIARDIACAALDARIVIIATQVRCSLYHSAPVAHSARPTLPTPHIFRHHRHRLLRPYRDDLCRLQPCSRCLGRIIRHC